MSKKKDRKIEKTDEIIIDVSSPEQESGEDNNSIINEKQEKQEKQEKNMNEFNKEEKNNKINTADFIDLKEEKETEDELSDESLFSSPETYHIMLSALIFFLLLFGGYIYKNKHNDVEARVDNMQTRLSGIEELLEEKGLKKESVKKPLAAGIIKIANNGDGEQTPNKNGQGGEKTDDEQSIPPIE